MHGFQFFVSVLLCVLSCSDGKCSDKSGMLSARDVVSGKIAVLMLRAPKHTTRLLNMELCVVTIKKFNSEAQSF